MGFPHSFIENPRRSPSSRRFQSPLASPQAHSTSKSPFIFDPPCCHGEAPPTEFGSEATPWDIILVG